MVVFHTECRTAGGGFRLDPTSFVRLVLGKKGVDSFFE